jgi:hypothetical protein
MSGKVASRIQIFIVQLRIRKERKHSQDTEADEYVNKKLILWE